jgi:hypothetical protein
MQRWKHAGRGPKYTLLLGILLGVASLVLNQNAYAQSQFGYPGNPATPTIPTGPSLGCTPTGQSNESYVCGFNPLSKVTFLVDGHFAGTATSDSNGCVLVAIAFLAGAVQIDGANGNARVHVRQGENFVTVIGHKNESGGTVKVGFRLPFSTPVGDSNTCVVSPSGPTSTTQFPTRPTSSTFPIETTIHGFFPTTLPKSIETPLSISPNRVILASSLLAAVLAAVLSAGAVGALWASGGSAEAGPGDALTAGAPPPPAQQPSGPGGSNGTGGPEPPGPGGPPGPTVPTEPATAPATPITVGRATSAFTRPDVGTTGGGGGGD